ncbi:MAG: hypothetical protein IRZ04_01025 [Rhodospirillales bacterium]|nr:hypothetical protein [Rhodospirillales bacterium]
MRRFSGRKAGTALAALLLASCSTAVDAVRDVTGTSKNDPGPEARNTRNLEAGSERPFPNLGTVPPPPVRALSTAEREALQKSLAADRANAKYIDEQLRAGQTASAPRPAPRPPSPPAEEAAQTAAPPPAAAAPRQATPSAAQTSPAPAANEPTPAPAAPGTVAAAPSPEPAPEPPPAAAPRTPVEAQELPNESPGVSPQVRSVPEPEAPQPAPPPPVLSGPGVLAARPPAAPPPASVPRAAPAPSSPQLASLPPGQPVAEIAFARDSAALPGSDRSRIEEIAAAQRARGGIVRVVAEAAPAGGADGALAAFGLALDRANAVAVALAEAGVPQQSIQVETAPPGRAPGRARVYLQN